MITDLFERDIVPDDLAVNALLPDSASNQLGVLRPEVEDQDPFVRHTNRRLLERSGNRAHNCSPNKNARRGTASSWQTEDYTIDGRGRLVAADACRSLPGFGHKLFRRGDLCMEMQAELGSLGERDA